MMSMFAVPAFQPSTSRHTHAVPAARSRPAALLNELWTPDALSGFPPGGIDLVPQAPAHTPFSHYLFNAIMTYIAIDISATAYRAGKRRMAPDEYNAERLAAAPPTNFGWVQADLRGPLPPLEELVALRVGLDQRSGATLHLCRQDQAIHFHTIERSLDFTEHYGEPVFICSGSVDSSEFVGDQAGFRSSA